MKVAYVSALLSELRGGPYLMFNLANTVSSTDMGSISFYSLETGVFNSAKVINLLTPEKQLRVRFVDAHLGPDRYPLSELQTIIQDAFTYGKITLSQVYFRMTSARLRILPSKVLVNLFSYLSKNYDVVHVGALETPFSSSIKFARNKKAKSKFVCHLIYHSVPYYLPQKLASVRQKFLLEGANSYDAVTCSTPFEANMLRSLGVKNVHFVGEGINMDYIEQHRVLFEEKSSAFKSRKNIAKSKTFIVLFIGFRSKLKGYYDALVAFNNMLGSGENNLLFIAIGRSDKSDESKVIDSIENDLQQSGHFISYDYVTEEDKYVLIATSDVVVIPSLYETISLVMLEAWAFKKPVVVADIPTVVSVTGRDSALITKFGDRKQIEQALLSLLNNPNYGRELGANGYNRVCSTYNLNAIAKKLATIYSEITS